ncbi:SAM-dependent DNA methyltransferase [Aureibaculum sp. A20]|uniref:site-specific DNA-methyltransferase (adenine-specific) n=1 Tax=Aureibaculum flavum TaxID=2795986 RepID=A0ABS0WX54_9FLAO|nr:N-6 DNA methylase [Aureibaculum flavum]MBJ2176481.1 SAM-dependent DNA methyltransferase [Aureibaculum flavum]
MKDLTDISIWKQNLGLLPIHLNPAEDNTNYVMLNGGYGDFCLQTINDNSDIDSYFSKSWSSNTKNFLVLDNDNINIYNWSKSKPEPIPKELVLNNFDKFYSYLLSKSFKSSKDVVPYIIDIFRQFRNLTQERTKPVEALNLLFLLLSSLEDDVNNFDFGKWNINNTVIPTNFDFYTDNIRTGVSNIKPELDLIIRHSAGTLFQEAQKEVLFFNPQRDLFGGVSNSLETKKELYSSIHYTPPFLSRTIVENALNQLDLTTESIKILDPSCGSSEFLIEALKQLKQLNYNGDIQIIGWDTSETAINTSNFLLSYEKRTIWKEKLNFKIELVEDSLKEEWEDNYDLILMNPPFVSWELLKNNDSKDAIRQVLGPNFNGKPNQASAFFYKSVTHLNENGVIGCVIPSSFLSLDSYKKLRNDIYDNIEIRLLGKLGNFVFEDALTDVSIIIGQKPKTNQVPTLLWTRNEKGIAQNALRDLRKLIYSNESTINNPDYSIYKPTTFPILNENWNPISLKNNNLFKTIERFIFEKKLIRTEDVFSIRLGIRQGAKDVFKLSIEEYNSLPENEKKYFRPVIDNKAINKGSLSLNNYIWFPYDKNGMLFSSEEELIEKAPIFYNSNLKPKEEILKKRASISYWWGLTRPGNWQFEKSQKLISKEFGGIDSFALDKEGSFVVERGNVWIPKKDFNQENYYFYLALFSSSFYNSLLSIYSKQLAGGDWYILGKKHTKDIPIPNAHSVEVQESIGYSKLVEIGKEISIGNSSVKQIADEVLTKYFYPINS